MLVHTTSNNHRKVPHQTDTVLTLIQNERSIITGEAYDASFAARFTARILHLRTWKRSSDSGIAGISSTFAVEGLSGLVEIAIPSFAGSTSIVPPLTDGPLKQSEREHCR
jgi:hypothetical protein